MPLKAEAKGAERFVLIYLSLLVLCTPIDYAFFPDLGMYMTQSWEAILQFLGILFHSETGARSFAVYSDSRGMYLMFAGCFPLAFLTFLIFSHFRPLVKSWISIGLTFLLLGFLVLNLGHYGIQKLFMRQFFPLDGKLLFTPLGQFDKDLLFWTTMGTSRLFNLITGGLELLTAFLILIPRMRQIGLLVSLILFSHILLLNLSFNIDVKLLVLLLLGIGIFLSLPLLRSITSSMHTGSIHIPRPFLDKSVKGPNWTLGVLILLELSMVARAAIATPNKALEHSLLSRSFESLNPTERDPKRLHFHTTGYLIEEFDDGRFLPVAMLEDRSIQMIRLTESGEELAYALRSDTLELRGILSGEEIAWQLLELDLE
ncbi:MAG: hypothetical protein O2867_06405 [Bacteroidetes bacterium]|nr:hypothetical protein [Bacteroidota bacterium]